MNKIERWLPYLDMLLAHWKLILLAGVLMGAVFGGVSKFFIKPTYVAKATLYCGRINHEEQARNFTTEYSKSLDVGLNLIADYRELMDSDRISSQTNRMLIEILQGKAPVPGKKPQTAPEAENEKDAVPVEVAGYKQDDTSFVDLDLLKEHCFNKKRGKIVIPRYKKIIKSTPKTRLLSITIEGRDPQAVALTANVCAEVFLREIPGIMQMENSQIIDYAKVPAYPVGPHFVRNAVIGVVLGMILMYGFFFLRNFIDMTVKSSEEATKLFRLPMIGVIPEFLSADPEKATEPLKIASSGKTHEMLEMAESFRAARANLQYDSFGKKDGGKIVMFTSAVPSEGKTTCAANFATSMAETGKRVILIDMDLRKPSIHKIFDVSRKTGLVNYLVGEKKLDEIIMKNVMNTSLDLVCCGPIPPNPSNLLVSKNMDSMLDQMRKDYDFIFIDAPPVAAAADAVTLGGKSDGILFILRSYCTRRNQIEQAVASLRQSKLNIIGLVLNRLPHESPGHYGYGSGYRYGYGSGYRYGYGYGYGYKQKKTDEADADGKGKTAKSEDKV